MLNYNNFSIINKIQRLYNFIKRIMIKKLMTKSVKDNLAQYKQIYGKRNMICIMKLCKTVKKDQK